MLQVGFAAVTCFGTGGIGTPMSVPVATMPQQASRQKAADRAPPSLIHSRSGPSSLIHS